jgi:hypothetical protein
MHGFGVKAFFAFVWIRWTGKLAPIKNNLGPRNLRDVSLKLGWREE